MTGRNPTAERGEATSARLHPEILGERCGPRSIEHELRVPPDLDCWPGHFPAWRVVPAVLQLDWVMRFAARWVGPRRLSKIEGLKFKQPMGPGQRFVLRLEAAADGARIGFQLADGGTVFSLGRLLMHEDAEGRP